MKYIDGVEVIEGNFFANNELTKNIHENAKIFIVASKWNAMVVDKLIFSAIDTLRKFGIEEKNIKVVKASGAWEMPLVVESILESDIIFDNSNTQTQNQELEQDQEQQMPFVGIIALGAVIEGDTLHFDVISSACNQGLAKLSLEFGIPIGNGVLVCRTMEQAMDRAGGKMGNKGEEAALAVLETLDLIGQIQNRGENAK